jgi:hypothetical protein
MQDINTDMKDKPGQKKPKRAEFQPPKRELSLDQKINELFNLSPIRAAISDQYGTAYKYAMTFGLKQTDVSRLLNKKCPITLKAVMKHCTNLGIKVKVTLTRE